MSVRVAACLGFVLSASLLVSGCGGGAEVDVTIPPPAAFDLGVKVNGQPLAGVDVFPDDEQTVQVHVGDTVEIDSSGGVGWETAAGASAGVPTETGGTYLYGGAALTETVSTPGELVLAVSAQQPLNVPAAIAIYATSLDDSTQTARVDLVVTN